MHVNMLNIFILDSINVTILFFNDYFSLSISYSNMILLSSNSLNIMEKCARIEKKICITITKLT